MTVFGLCEALTTNSTGKLLLLLFSHKLTFQTSLIIFEYTHWSIIVIIIIIVVAVVTVYCIMFKVVYKSNVNHNNVFIYANIKCVPTDKNDNKDKCHG